MKKELRKIGFVLVAATAMFAYSCGAAEEETTEAPAETPVVIEEPVIVEPVTVDTAAACDAACEGGACDGAEKH